MDRELVLKLAKEAGLIDWTEDGNWSAVDCDLVRFANLVAAHEREQCAKVCDEEQTKSYLSIFKTAARLIRARSKT
jgi:hypothetical protein